MNRTRIPLTIFTVITALIFVIAISGCKKDEVVPPRTSTYPLLVKDVLGVSGSVKFTETSSTSTTIDIVLTGAPSGTHPAQLCMNSAIEGGSVVINLEPVDETGKSSTVTTLKTYSELIEYDGFVKVLKSSNEANIILAQGDIGGNVITTTKKSYTLLSAGSFGVSGTALFEKRLNGNTLLTITLTGTIPNDVYPATINLGSIESVGGGPVVLSLSAVNGNTGKSYTNIRKLNSGINITYDNWLVYDGYINVYQNSVSYDNIICHGNIGSN